MQYICSIVCPWPQWSQFPVLCFPIINNALLKGNPTWKNNRPCLINICNRFIFIISKMLQIVYFILNFTRRSPLLFVRMTSNGAAGAPVPLFFKYRILRKLAENSVALCNFSRVQVVELQ